MLLHINFQDVVIFQIVFNFGVHSWWPSLLFIGGNTLNILKGFFPPLKGGGWERSHWQSEAYWFICPRSGSSVNMNVLLIRLFISLFIFLLLFSTFCLCVVCIFFIMLHHGRPWIPKIVCIFYLPFTKHMLPERGRCIEMNKSSAFEQILHGSVEMYRTQISNYTNFYDGTCVRENNVLAPLTAQWVQ